ncbi:MAG: Xaa-Pro peptidase family protein [Thermoproteota archaeon]|nr:Xaa-Pro peptidase family protein [Thermoproteota archaeon]
MINRIEALKKSLQEKNLDGYVLANGINIQYFTDAVGAACLLVPTEGENVLYVYAVNYEAAKAEAKHCWVEQMKSHEKIVEKVAKQIENLKLKKLGFDVFDASIYLEFKKAFKKTVELKGESSLVWELRKVKDKEELKRMRKAAELTSKGMQVAAETVQPGVREYEVAAEVEYTMRRQGSWGTAFDTIVASGVHSAYPHGGCTEQKIRKGDLVVVDIGAAYRNYQSDMTRTFVAGKPSVKQEKIYQIVKEAQEKAFQSIKAGVKAADVHRVARRVIKKAGYAEYFVHSLGHGVGMEVHEPPRLSPESKNVLNAGNMVTVEPGIYIANFGGVRIEDTVLVEETKAEKLTKGNYTLKPES